MAPPPRPKRVKRPATILAEDDYTSALSHIIARDFFPGLVETEAQQEYLDALASQDEQWITSAGQKLTQLQTPGPDGRRARGKRGTSLASATPVGSVYSTAGATPRGWTGATPVISVADDDGNEDAPSKRNKADRNLSLGTFQSKYTSEDNESFNKLLDKQNEHRIEMYAWLWNGNKAPSNRQIAWHERQTALEAAADAQKSEDGKLQLSIKGPDQRKAMPDSWKSRPDNNLMFAPGSVEDEMQTLQQKAEAESRAGPKAVAYDNTRMPVSSAAASHKTPESPSLSAVQDAIAGKPRLSRSEVSGYGGGETPRVNGYAFVDSEEPEPEPAPPTQMDWSNIALGPGDATPNPFSIKEQSSREALHHRMVDKVAKNKRMESFVAKTKTPVPKFMSSPRPGREGLTPAGQRLLGRLGEKTPGGTIWEGSSTPKARTPRKTG